MVTTRRGLHTAASTPAVRVADVNVESTFSPGVERRTCADNKPVRNGADNGAVQESPPERKFRDYILGEIWMEIDASIAENGGSSYGIISAKINQHKKKFAWVNRDLLYNYRKQATKEMVLPPHEILLQSTCKTNATSQLSASIIDTECADNGSTDHQDEPEENLTSTDESRNFGGRPKGSTNEA